MKKLGISLVAVLVGLPVADRADITPITLLGNPAGTVASNTNVATTSYVKGAYNDLAGHINTNVTAINANTTAIAGKQDQLVNDAGTPADISNTVATTVRAAGSADDETLVTEAAVRAAIDASGSTVKGVQVNGSDLTPDANGKVNVTVATGTGDGTIAVNGTDVSVAGLGSAAYEDTTAFDAAGTAEGLVGDLTTLTTTDKTDVVSAINEVAAGAAAGATALQAADITTGATNGTIAVDGTDVAVYGLGSAAFVNTGALADTAGTYDNTGSGLTATTIQDAIDEVATAVDGATNKQVEVYTTWNTTTTGKADALVDPDPVTPEP